jgi:hypothetical protein
LSEWVRCHRAQLARWYRPATTSSSTRLQNYTAGCRGTTATGPAPGFLLCCYPRAAALSCAAPAGPRRSAVGLLVRGLYPESGIGLQDALAEFAQLGPGSMPRLFRRPAFSGAAACASLVFTILAGFLFLNTLGAMTPAARLPGVLPPDLADRDLGGEPQRSRLILRIRLVAPAVGTRTRTN